MKKFLVVVFAAFMVASCFDHEYQTTKDYNMFASFEYDKQYGYDMSNYFGKDSLYCEHTYGYGLGWDDMGFCHKVDSLTREFQGGFVLSRLKGKVYADSLELNKDIDLYRVNAPADSSRMYLVFIEAELEDHMPKHDVEFMMDEYGSCKVIGCYVNVPLYVAAAAVKEFKDGDYLSLKATGYREGKVTSEKSIDLITCGGGKVNLSEKWMTLDLSALGDIQYVDFDVTSSNENVPEVFCLDNFGAKISIAY